MPLRNSGSRLLIIGMILALASAGVLVRQSFLRAQLNPLVACCPAPNAGACTPDLTIAQCQALGPMASFVMYTPTLPRADAIARCNAGCAGGGGATTTDLAVSLACSCTGTLHSCSIRVLNTGSIAADDVGVKLTLGGNPVVVGGSVTPMNVTGGGTIALLSNTDGGTTILWGSPSAPIPAGGTASTTVQFRAGAGGDGAGSVTVALNGTSTPDSNPANDSDTKNLPALNTCGGSGGSSCPPSFPLCTGSNTPASATCGAGQIPSTPVDPLACNAGSGGFCYACSATSAASSSQSSVQCINGVATVTTTVLAGDKDGFGIGIPAGGSYPDFNAFTPDANDGPMDRVLIANSWGPAANQNSAITSPNAMKAAAVVITGTQIPPGATLQSAQLIVNTADVDDGIPSSYDPSNPYSLGLLDLKLSLNGQDVPGAFDNVLQMIHPPADPNGLSGVTGTSTFSIPLSLAQQIVQSGQASVLIDEPTRAGKIIPAGHDKDAEMFAIDYMELKLTYTSTGVCPPTGSSSSSSSSTTTSSSSTSASSSSAPFVSCSVGQCNVSFTGGTCTGQSDICGVGIVGTVGGNCGVAGSCGGACITCPSSSSSSSTPNSCNGYECALGASGYCQAQGLGCKQLMSGACFTCSGLCGNHVLDPGEGCDDGNTNNGDGCDSNCQPEGGMCGVSP